MEPHDLSNPFDFYLDQLGIGKRTGDRGCDGMPGIWQQIADKLYPIPAFAGGYPDYGSLCGNCRAAKGKRTILPADPADRDSFWSGKYFYYVSIVRVDLVADRKRGTMIEIAIEKKEIGERPFSLT